jgi:hypothetical protein
MYSYTYVRAPALDRTQQEWRTCGAGLRNLAATASQGHISYGPVPKSSRLLQRTRTPRARSRGKRPALQVCVPMQAAEHRCRSHVCLFTTTETVGGRPNQLTYPLPCRSKQVSLEMRTYWRGPDPHRVLVETVPVPRAHLCEQEVSRIGLRQMRCVTRTNRRRAGVGEGAAEGREDVRLKSHTITEQNRRPSFPLYLFFVLWP